MIYQLQENRVYRTYRGGNRLDLFLGKEKGETDYFPEDWTASVTKAFNPGREDLIEGYGKTVDGEEVRQITDVVPRCLVKLLDSEERLVVQVHPTRDFARDYFHSEFGKTECWYFLDCDADACVYIGFREGITAAEWREVFDRQDIPRMLSMLHRVPVKKGDCIFVDGGVPHAIGKGCFLIEVQEPTDLMGVTERQTPSGRVLPEIKLHGGIGIDNMMKMFSYDGYTEQEILARHRMSGAECGAVRKLVGKDRTDKFSMIELSGNVSVSLDYPAGVIIVTDGEGTLNGVPVKAGDRLFYCEESKLSLCAKDFCKAVICC